MPRPRVDFYVLPGSDASERLRFACRLVEQAYLDRQQVRVRLEGAELAAFDDLLWTFSDQSFVPHERLVAGPAAAPVVLAETSAPEPPAGDLLVNLGADVAAGWDHYARIAEIVDADGERRQLGRSRFRFYREQGLEPATHDTGSAR